MSGDAYHITAPAEDGDGGFRAMQAALKRAGLAAEDIDYVNAHGTSTPLGDLIEAGAVRRLLGDAVGDVSMSSTKSATGHLLGAAGAIEAIYSIKTVQTGDLPPTLDLNDPEDAVADFDLVTENAQARGSQCHVEFLRLWHQYLADHRRGYLMLHAARYAVRSAVLLGLVALSWAAPAAVDRLIIKADGPHDGPVLVRIAPGDEARHNPLELGVPVRS